MHLASQTSRGPGPASLHPPEARLQMAGAARQVGDPLLWKKQEMVIADMKPAHGGLSSVPPVLPGRKPLPTAEGICARPRNALSPEPCQRQQPRVSYVLGTEIDWIQATFGWGREAGLSWSLLPPSGQSPEPPARSLRAWH